MLTHCNNFEFRIDKKINMKVTKQFQSSINKFLKTVSQSSILRNCDKMEQLFNICFIFYKKSCNNITVSIIFFNSVTEFVFIINFSLVLYFLKFISLIGYIRINNKYNKLEWNSTKCRTFFLSSFTGNHQICY